MTPPPTRSVSDDAAALASTVADALITRLVSLQSSGHEPSVVLTGGSIADRIHAAVASHSEVSSVAWDRVDFWFGDERFVAADSSERNEVQAREAMLDALPLDPARVHAMGADAGRYAGNPEAAADDYTEALSSELGDRPFDVVMLGVGPDGHCASLFPGQSQVLATVPVTVVPVSPKPPPVRLSLSIPRLSHADSVWFVAAGDEKAHAVASALDPEADPWHVPAAGPRGRQETTWYLDQHSAELLP